MPFSETGDETGDETEKTEQKRSEKDVKTGFPGQKFNLRQEREPGTGKGNQEPKKETGIKNGKSPGFLGTNPEQKNGTKKG